MIYVSWLRAFAENKVPHPGLHRTSRLQGPSSVPVRFTSFHPLPPETEKRMESSCHPPSCTANTLPGRIRERLRSDLCQERPGAHYIFFATPVKTGINTRHPELQAGSCPVLTVVWRLQSKHVEIKDSSNTAIESQKPSAVRFISRRSINIGRRPLGREKWESRSAGPVLMLLWRKKHILFFLDFVFL